MVYIPMIWNLPPESFPLSGGLEQRQNGGLLKMLNPVFEEHNLIFHHHLHLFFHFR